jgi:hypothetical protein
MWLPYRLRDAFLFPADGGVVPLEIPIIVVPPSHAPILLGALSACLVRALVIQANDGEIVSRAGPVVKFLLL